MCSHFAPKLRVLPKRRKGNIVDSDWNSALKLAQCHYSAVCGRV